MSLDATRWAWQQRVGRSTAKLVLLALADAANHIHECFPSISRLEEDTELNRKTIIGALQELMGLGLVEDTGARRGETGQVKVLRLVGVEDRHKNTENGTASTRRKNPKFGTASTQIGGESGAGTGGDNDTECGTVKEDQKRNGSESGTVPKTGGNSTVFSAKESQKRDTESTKEPIRNQNPIDSMTQDKPKRKRQLPADFELTIDRVRAAGEFWQRQGRMDLVAATEFEQFIAHHRSRATTMADWDAAWKTWYCNAVKFNRPPGGGYANSGSSGNGSSRGPRSATGRLSALVAAERAEREAAAAGGHSRPVGAHGQDVRPSLDEPVRGRDRPGERVGCVVEGDFTRTA